jgi:hypothetical protein
MSKTLQKLSASVAAATGRGVDVPRPPSSARALRALAVGALACGALAFGAVALGAVAIGRLTINRVRIRHLEVDELVVRGRPPIEGAR